ncbi:MAG: DUF2158 domain-containing protein [Erythrobacter sp.]|nr:MAG: DUF2158 domain-containing protein [Erythrobacter sp.]
MEITKGQVVQLKSGGPTMTVEWVEGEEAYCVWFDGKKTAGQKFKCSSLQSYP